VPEVWTVGIPFPGLVEAMATRAEAAGFDGFAVVDSQNLAGDCYVGLTLAATVTERIGIGTAVTNPVTRHPAVTAAAAASLQLASAGRFVLGIGRGDSALAHLGRAPASVVMFEQYLIALQSYLRGEGLAFDDLDFHEGVAPPVGTLGLASTPDDSRLHWIASSAAKVPVEVAATGERVIGAAARHADRVMLAVGADERRIRWGIATARSARADAGLDPDALAIGAFVNVVAHDDLDVARTLVSGGLSTFARFSVMHGTPSGPFDESQREVLDTVHGAYDMNVHTQTGSPQASALTPEFIDRFAIVGTADTCRTRLAELVALGLDKLIVTGPSIGADRQQARVATERFAADVLPALHR